MSNTKKFELEIDDCWITTFKEHTTIKGDIINAEMIRDLILLGIDNSEMSIYSCDHDDDYEHVIKVKELKN